MVNKTLATLAIASDKLTRDDVLTLNDALQHNKTLKFLRLAEKVAKTVDKRILPCNWQSVAHLDQHNEFYGFQNKSTQNTTCISTCHTVHMVSN